MHSFDKSLLHPRYWAIWFGYGLLRLLVLLPYPWVQRFGLWLGYTCAPLFKRRGEITRVNAELCFPELQGEAKEQFVKDVIANNVLGFFETFYSWWGSEKSLRKHSRLEGLELIEEAQANNQGVILIGGHFSILDMSARIITLRHKAGATYRKQDNPMFDWLVNSGRARFISELIEKREMRKMIRSLRKGNVIWYATDQDFGRKNSVFAPFFGIEAATVTTIADLIRMTGAKPLFYSGFREGAGKHTSYVGRISDPYQGQFGDDDVANATLLNKALEDSLKAHDPSQYLWVHRRFKTRPSPDEPGFYAKKKKNKKKN